MSEGNKRWFVIIGLLNKVISNEEAKELYQSGRIKIYGPYTDQEIKAFYESKKLLNENIIQKVGDNFWKPVHSQDDIFIRSLLSKDIFIEKKQDRKDEPVVMVIQSIENPKKKFFIWFCIILALLLVSYYYYDVYYCDTKEFYKRLKKNVVVIYTMINNEIKGLGTGFFLKDSGLILTNFHVISQATDISIKAGDGKIFTPESVNFIDVVNDLALIKVKETDGLPKGISLTDSDKMEEGDKIFVIGNPAGFELSLSEGIVSGKRNIDPITQSPREIIQMTAPISPGSSGSPVFNKRGKVIGIASMASAGKLQNLNFAASIKPVLNYKDYVNSAYFKFLSRNANWIYVDTSISFGVFKSNYYFTERGILSFNCYYAPETLVQKSQDIRTVWLRIDGNFTTRLESNLFYNLYSDTSQNFYLYQLYEVDCRNMNFITRLSLFHINDSLNSIRENFDKDNWEDLKLHKLAEKICK